MQQMSNTWCTTDIHIIFTQNELIELGLGIAEDKISEIEIGIWINGHLTSENPIR